MITAANGWNINDKPKALLCHICGREYGTTSLKIHVPQCEKLFIERESLKPKSQRRSVPTAISIDTNNMNNMNIQQYNQQAYQQYQTESMITCEWCNRRFADDRIHIHHKSCTQDNPAKRVDQVATRTSTGQVKPHRLDAVANKQLNINKSTSDKENVIKSSTLKSPAPIRPKTSNSNTLTPNNTNTVIDKPAVSPRSPSIFGSNQSPYTIDFTEYNELKMRVGMLEDQLDMLLSTIGGEENRAQSRQATNECINCGAIAASIYCAACGTKQ